LLKALTTKEGQDLEATERYFGGFSNLKTLPPRAINGNTCKLLILQPGYCLIII
jgi:hypothetical protein